MENAIHSITTKEQAHILKILSVEARVKILYMLKENSLCVNALSCKLGISAGAVSQHLRIMRDASIVIDEKRGYYVHYRLNEETMGRWKAMVDNLLSKSSSKTMSMNPGSDEKWSQ